MLRKVLQLGGKGDAWQMVWSTQIVVTFARDLPVPRGSSSVMPRLPPRFRPDDMAPSAGGQVFQVQTKKHPPLSRGDTRKAYTKGIFTLKEKTRKAVNTKRDKEGLWGCSGSVLTACRCMDLKPETDLIRVDKAEVLLQI